MSEKMYQDISAVIRRRPYGPVLINLIDRLITVITFTSYPLLLIYIYFHDKRQLLPLILVPAVSFILVSVFRDAMHAERPYEKYDFDPVIHKNTVNHSFPSRHVFSNFMIAMTFLQVNVRLGIDFLILGAVMAVIRVLGGVHFIRDVVCGAALGVVLGIIGYAILPV